MAKNAKWGIETHGIKALQTTLKAMGEPEAPFLRTAMGEVATLLEREVASRAPGSMGAKLRSSVSTGKTISAKLVDKHPGAKPMEFGRTHYYAGYHGRAMKATGHQVTRKGQAAKPFIGVKRGDMAIGVVMPKAKELIAVAMVAEFDRLSAKAGADE